MNVAKWLLLALLALPLAELAAFIAVASAIGFLAAFGLLLATSFAGALVLQRAGGSHIARVRTAWDNGSFTSLQADSSGALILLAGILLLIPGFITDVLGVLLLLSPLRQLVSKGLGRGAPAKRADGVVDLPPEDWHQVADPALPDRRDNKRKG
jgi:UPF0716 protein FxsA